MAGARTAQWLIETTREHLQLFTRVGGQQVRYRDGFAGEDATGVTTSLLRHLNGYLAELARDTGCRQRTFLGALAPGQALYDLDESVIAIASVEVQGRPLFRTSLRGLDQEEAGWRTTPVRYPERWFRSGADQWGVWPRPDAARPYALVATTHFPDLLLPTDTIDGLPHAFHDDVPYGVALRVASMDFEAPVNQARFAFLQAQADGLKAALNNLLDEQGGDDAAPLGFDRYYAAPVVAGGNGQ